MKFIYVHHAERDRSNKNVPRQEQDITERGVQEATLLEKKINDLGVTKIYSSTYKRCLHTANILNKNKKLEIIKEERLNEWDKNETFKYFLERNIEAIDEIKRNSNEDDVIMCITSGINLSAFVCYFTNSTPSDNSPRIQGITISPVLFSTNKQVF